MTTPRPGGLVEGTLADLRTLMSKPPYPRRGNAYLDTPANPAAGAGFTHKVDSAWWERLVSLYFVYAAASGGNARSVVVNLMNGDGTVFNVTGCIEAVSGGETWIVSADLSGSPGIPGGSAVSGAGEVTSPTLGQTIAQVTIPAGEWTANWNVQLGGTPSATDTDNFRLTGPIGGGVTSDNPGAVGGPWAQNPVTFEVLAGGVNVKVIAIAAGTAGAIYSASLTLTPVASSTSQPQLPDITLKSGWQWQIAVAGIQAGDQISGIAALCERYPSNWADGSLDEDLELIERMALG